MNTNSLLQYDVKVQQYCSYVRYDGAGRWYTRTRTRTRTRLLWMLGWNIILYFMMKLTYLMYILWRHIFWGDGMMELYECFMLSCDDDTYNCKLLKDYQIPRWTVMAQNQKSRSRKVPTSPPRCSGLRPIVTSDSDMAFLHYLKKRRYDTEIIKSFFFMAHMMVLSNIIYDTSVRLQGHSRILENLSLVYVQCMTKEQGENESRRHSQKP